MISIRKVLPLLLVTVLATIILVCPGIATHSLKVSLYTNVIFIVELLISLIATVTFIFFLGRYPTTKGDAGSSRMMAVDGESFKVFLFDGSRMSSVFGHLSKKTTVIAVYLFGGGSVLLSVACIYSKAQCIGFFTEFVEDTFVVTKEKVSLLTCVIKLLSTVVAIPFLHRLSQVTHCINLHVIATSCLVLLFGIEVAKFVYAILYATSAFQIFSTETHGDYLNMRNLTFACLNNHSSIAEVYTHQTIESEFWSFDILFAFVAIEILTSVYFIRVRHSYPAPGADFGTVDPQNAAINKLEELCQTQNVCLVPTEIEIETDDKILSDSINPYFGSYQDQEDENSSLINSARRQRARRPAPTAATNGPSPTTPTGNEIHVELVQSCSLDDHAQQSVLVRAWSRVIWLCTPTLALVVGLIEWLMIKFYLLYAETLKSESKNPKYIDQNYLDHNCTVPLLAFSILLNGIPMLLVTTHSLLVLKKCQHQRPKSPSIKISIILASVGIFILNAFFVIVSIMTLTNPTMSTSMWTLTLLDSFITWPQYYMQIVLLYLGQKRLPDIQKPFFPTLKGAFSYLAMNNLMHFIVNASVGTDYLIARLEGMDQWSTLVHICIPLLIYFYFLCTFSLLEVKQLMEDAETPRQRWRLELQVGNLRPHMR